MPKAFREGGYLPAASMMFLAKRRFADGATLRDTSPLPKSGSLTLAELRPPLKGEVGIASRIPECGTLATIVMDRRRDGGVLLDEAPLRLAEEERAVGDQPADVGLGAEGGFGGLDAVEPDLADAVPMGLLRVPARHRAEAKPAEAGETADDVGMRTHPVGEELLVGHAGLAADEADALDHGHPLGRRLRRRLKELQRDAVVDAEIGAARAPVFGPWVDVDRALRHDRPRAECDGPVPGRIDVVDREAEMHVAGIGGGVGIRRLARDLVVEELEPTPPGRSTKATSMATPG